jgi:hypothetical protein
MPTTYKDQFFTVDPGAPPAVGTLLTFDRVEFGDNDDNNLIQPNTGDTFNGLTITSVWVNDTLTINVPGTGNITYTGVTFYVTGGPAVFTPNDGQALQDGTFVSSSFVTSSTQIPVSDFGPTCFTPGTMIDTPDGARAIEEIGIGDWVETLDNGAQQVRMVLRDSFRAVAQFAPIRFEKGAIGNDEVLIVSPQHRMLISGWQAELIAGQEEMLVAAKHLVNGADITQPNGGIVEYIHLVFDDHQVIFGQGVPSESCFPSHLVDGQRDETQAEVLALFPQIADLHASGAQLVRPEMRRFEAQLLAA